MLGTKSYYSLNMVFWNIVSVWIVSKKTFIFILSHEKACHYWNALVWIQCPLQSTKLSLAFQVHGGGFIFITTTWIWNCNTAKLFPDSAWWCHVVRLLLFCHKVDFCLIILKHCRIFILGVNNPQLWRNWIRWRHSFTLIFSFLEQFKSI